MDYVGTDEINPPVEAGPFTFTSWSEISQVCGDSRVWGGMHFEVRATNHASASHQKYFLEYSSECHYMTAGVVPPVAFPT